MGTPFAVTYANIFMTYWMKKYWDPLPNKPDINYRFIDDIWALTSCTIEESNNFLYLLNQQHPTIKFTMTISDKSVPFLDVNIIREGDFLETNLYSKKTDSHHYIPPSSCHPKHVFHSIPYSGALRIKRICSKPQWMKP